MNTWTAQQVIALAPDAASASAGQSLSSGSKWQGAGRSERAIWGLCKGSGKNPYQTRIDLGEPAFKCSCPSRKFPCKHGLGLLQLFANQPAAFAAGDEPGWVSEWLDGRQERTANRAERAEQEAAEPIDPAAQAKRAEKRAQNIEEGIRHCRLWLDDLARRGLAAAQSDARTEWETTAARMVDAQATGLAN
ncbi:SWIM zinc finger family protein, partial [Limnoraphis robusta]